MDIKRKITDEEKNILYKVADEFQTIGKSNIQCPRCEGKLEFIGNMSAYRIWCDNSCGIIFTVRGI